MHNSCLLAIETSCDDTSVAVLKNSKILANITANQLVHEKYGGVVPELASRNHEKNMVWVYQEALKKAQIEATEIDSIAFTQGPGLLGSLLVGSSFAKSLSWALKKPLIAVNHLEAHIASLYIENENPPFPFLCMLVSGGHTELILVKDYFKFEKLGNTLDDAAGEAFDKIGKMLELGYPAGPKIDKLARKGNASAFKFTYSKVPDYNYSFSGLKTQVLYFLRDMVKENPQFIKESIEDLCASVQQHIITYLLKPVEKIMLENNVVNLGLVGGVSANSQLRKEAQDLAKKHGGSCLIPSFEFCTDNAGMIAKVGEFKYNSQEFVGLDVTAKSRF